MSFKVVSVVLASAVASAGTFTAAYPDGTSAGDFATYGHSMFARGLQSKFTQDAGQMSVSFGATEITVTYSGSTSIPAGTTVTCEFNQRGANDGKAPEWLSGMKRLSFLSPIRIDLGSPDVADDNGVAASQSVAEDAAFSLNGALVVDGEAVFDVPRNVVAAWTTNAQITVTGEDEYGNVVVEQSSAATTSLTGKKAFKKVTSVTSDTAITSATVGTGDVLGLPVFVERVGSILTELKNGVAIPNVGGKVVYLTGTILEADVDTPAPLNMVSPVAGFVRKVSVISAADGVTTGGAFTVEINGTAIDGLSVVVANSAVEGEVDSDTPTKDHATTAIAAGDRIEIIPGSAFNGAADFDVVVEIEATYALDGTFVAGVQTKPTAVTGDVRGTYDPSTACDGSTAFALVALLPDPTYKGVTQYDG